MDIIEGYSKLTRKYEVKEVKEGHRSVVISSPARFAGKSQQPQGYRGAKKRSFWYEANTKTAPRHGKKKPGGD